MSDFARDVVMLAASGLLSLFAFLFSAWIRGQMHEKLLEMELRFMREYVPKDDLDKHMDEMKKTLETMTKQLAALQRIVDRRFGGGGDADH